MWGIGFPISPALPSIAVRSIKAILLRSKLVFHTKGGHDYFETVAWRLGCVSQDESRMGTACECTHTMRLRASGKR